MNNVSKINPAGFNKGEIKFLAKLFAKKLNFNPIDIDIRKFVEDTLHGKILFDNKKIKPDGGSILVPQQNGEDSTKFVIYLSDYTLEW